MAITTAASRLGTEPFSDASRVELRPHASKEEVQAVMVAFRRTRSSVAVAEAMS